MVAWCRQYVQLRMFTHIHELLFRTNVHRPMDPLSGRSASTSFSTRHSTPSSRTTSPTKLPVSQNSPAPPTCIPSKPTLPAGSQPQLSSHHLPATSSCPNFKLQPLQQLSNVVAVPTVECAVSPGQKARSGMAHKVSDNKWLL